MPPSPVAATRVPPPFDSASGAAANVPLIELRHVSKSYTTTSGPTVTILDDVSLEVRAGEMLGLLGQSGCGKSTILRLMAGLTAPSSGAVLSHGSPLAGINRDLAIVFQSFALYPWLTVQQNVQVGLVHRRLGARAEQEEIEKALELIGLSGYENAYPKQLSGGMRQRVGFARAIVAQSEVLAMDEAFSALDVLTAENLRSEVVQLWRNAPDTGFKSIFFVTHNIAEAAYMASRIVIISPNPGRIKRIIANPMPYPRDVNSKEFAALVEQIHDAITAVALPDVPAEPVVTVTAIPMQEPGAPSAEATRAAVAHATPVEPIPNVPVGAIVGLLGILEDNDERINLFDLSARIGQEFGETIAIVKAAEMLDLVETPKNEVVMTRLGWYFLAAPIPAQKTLFKHQILKLRLFQMLTSGLQEAPDHRIGADAVKEQLVTLLPYDQSDKLLEVLVAWGRHAGILDYDESTRTVSLTVPEPSAAEKSEEEGSAG
ncbi:MAG TPA: nitrate/sulfonate/bicarbonate ABC transporter ATP-binding protein [Burkholderiales bacterium]|nr:nitrate/sulfonate/bicarbonate ABC transporter ATP-binding protein [Burkholderiales bacterium]